MATYGKPSANPQSAADTIASPHHQDKASTPTPGHYPSDADLRIPDYAL
jgi:hypothetical protein